MNEREANISPMTGAITVGLSFFVGLMSIFVAVLAFAVAGRQDNPNAGSGMHWSNSTAMWMSYAVGIVSLINSVVSFGRARLRPGVTAVCTTVFIISILWVNLLFVRAW